jgi:hypothetical protein
MESLLSGNQNLLFNSKTQMNFHIRPDLFIYLKQSARLMEKITMMALVTMIAFVGIGFAVPAMPLITEVSAQGNMTGNATGNNTDTGEVVGNVSALANTP